MLCRSPVAVVRAAAGRPVIFELFEYTGEYTALPGLPAPGSGRGVDESWPVTGAGVPALVLTGWHGIVSGKRSSLGGIMENDGRRKFLGVCLGGSSPAWRQRWISGLPLSGAPLRRRDRCQGDDPGKGCTRRRSQILRVCRILGGAGQKAGRWAGGPFGGLHPSGLHRAVGKGQAGFSLPLPCRAIIRPMAQLPPARRPNRSPNFPFPWPTAP